CRPRTDGIFAGQSTRRRLRVLYARLGHAAARRAQVLFPRRHAHRVFRVQETVVGQRMKPINVGLLGIGTVGGGAWNVLKRNSEEITRRAGREIRITAVADKDAEKAKRLTNGDAPVLADAMDIVNDPNIDIVV